MTRSRRGIGPRLVLVLITICLSLAMLVPGLYLLMGHGSADPPPNPNIQVHDYANNTPTTATCYGVVNVGKTLKQLVAPPPPYGTGNGVGIAINSPNPPTGNALFKYVHDIPGGDAENTIKSAFDGGGFPGSDVTNALVTITFGDGGGSGLCARSGMLFQSSIDKSKFYGYFVWAASTSMDSYEYAYASVDGTTKVMTLTQNQNVVSGFARDPNYKPNWVTAQPMPLTLASDAPQGTNLKDLMTTPAPTTVAGDNACPANDPKTGYPVLSNIKPSTATNNPVTQLLRCIYGDSSSITSPDLGEIAKLDLGNPKDVGRMKFPAFIDQRNIRFGDGIYTMVSWKIPDSGGDQVACNGYPNIAIFVLTASGDPNLPVYDTSQGNTREKLQNYPRIETPYDGNDGLCRLFMPNSDPSQFASNMADVMSGINSGVTKFYTNLDVTPSWINAKYFLVTNSSTSVKLSTGIPIRLLESDPAIDKTTGSYAVVANYYAKSGTLQTVFNGDNNGVSENQITGSYAVTDPKSDGDFFLTGNPNSCQGGSAPFFKVPGGLAGRSTGAIIPATWYVDFNTDADGNALGCVTTPINVQIRIADPSENEEVQKTPALTANTSQGINCHVTVLNPLSWFLCPLASGLLGIAAGLDNLINGQLYFNTSQLQSYTRGFANVRSLALGLIGVGALVAIVSQAIGLEIIDAYTIRKILPRIFICALGIALAWPLTNWFIQLTNDLGVGVGRLIMLAAPSSPGTVDALTGGGGFLATLFTAGAIVSLGFVGLLSFAATGALAAAVAYLVLILRQMIIVVLVVFAPLAIAAYLLPNTHKMWKIWWESFSKVLLMFPMITAIIAAGRVFASTTDSPILAFVAYFAPYFLIPLTFRFAGGLMGTLGGFVNDKSKGLFDGLKNFRASERKHRRENPAYLGARIRQGLHQRRHSREADRINKLKTRYDQGTALAGSASAWGRLRGRAMRASAGGNQALFNHAQLGKEEAERTGLINSFGDDSHLRAATMFHSLDQLVNTNRHKIENGTESFLGSDGSWYTRQQIEEGARGLHSRQAWSEAYKRMLEKSEGADAATQRFALDDYRRSAQARGLGARDAGGDWVAAALPFKHLAGDLRYASFNNVGGVLQEHAGEQSQRSFIRMVGSDQGFREAAQNEGFFESFGVQYEKQRADAVALRARAATTQGPDRARMLHEAQQMDEEAVNARENLRKFTGAMTPAQQAAVQAAGNQQAALGGAQGAGYGGAVSASWKVEQSAREALRKVDEYDVQNPLPVENARQFSGGRNPIEPGAAPNNVPLALNPNAQLPPSQDPGAPATPAIPYGGQYTGSPPVPGRPAVPPGRRN